jgi:hypothetical protein
MKIDLDRRRVTVAAATAGPAVGDRTEAKRRPEHN